MRFIWILFWALPGRAEEWVRVRLSQDVATNYTVTGTVHRLQGIEAPFTEVSIPQLQKITLKYNGQWTVEGFKKFAIIFPNNNLILEGYKLTLNGKPVPDKVILHADKNKINLVAVLPIEKYITGVLVHEMPSSWPLETLKAQAVAARSYAMAVKNERKNKVFHLESSVLDQVYGLLPEEDLKQRFGTILEAVKATEGQVLKTAGLKILKAFYHADCGGETATAKTVWNTKDETVAVKDKFCPQRPKSRWEMNINNKALTEKLQAWAPPGSRQVASLRPIYNDKSVRVSEIEVQWDQGLKTSLSANLFRQALGFFELKSTNFQIKEADGSWQIQGRGFGHGVGLCQWGSRYLGQKGWVARDILRHYYPKAQLARSQTPLEIQKISERPL